MKRKNKQLIKTIFISGTSVFISYFINFLITPYITNNVGLEAYGFVSIAKTAVSYAQIVMVALTTFIVRFISVSYHENKLEESQSYYSSSLTGCVCLSGIIFAIAVLLIWNLERFLNISDALIVPVKLLFVMVFINFVLTTLITPVSCGCYIKNRLDIMGVIKLISYICDAMILLVLFSIFQPEIWFVGVGSITASVVILLGAYRAKNKLTPELVFNRKLVSISRIFQMMSNGIWQSINSLGNTLNSGLDLMISNLMLTGSETGQIAIVKTISLMFSVLYQTVFQPFQPQLLKSYASGNRNVFVRELRKAMKICGFFSNTAFAGFVALGNLYFTLWLPNQDGKLLYYLTVVAIFISITEGVMTPVYYVNTLTLKKKIPCLVTVVGGFLNVISMYLLLKYTKMGVYAILLTTTVIMTGINLFFCPVYAAKSLGIKLWSIYAVIIRHILSVICMSYIFCQIARIMKPANWLELVGNAAVMVVIGLGIHAAAMKGID